MNYFYKEFPKWMIDPNFHPNLINTAVKTENMLNNSKYMQ